MSTIPFSVVTTCRNEMRSLPRWKQNILDQTRQPNELVIVDAFSDDGTFEYLLDWAEKDFRIKVLQKKGNAAIGRNYAIENAQFEHILSTDMGVRLNEIWCEELIIPFEKDPTVEVVAGNTCIDTETIKSKVGWAEYYFENGGFAKLEPGHVPGNRSIAYKKRIWEEIGRLPEQLTFYADDSVFGRQLVQNGYKFAFAPNAMTYWGRPSNLKQFFREQFVYGKGDGEAYIKTPKSVKFYLNKMIPAFFCPFFSGLINLIKKNTWKGVARALDHGDLIAAFFIPILIFGKFYNHTKGYLVGYHLGQEKCKEVRLRINRDPGGFATI
ncbi:glycosyltransferase [Algoriphagus aquatilis]|uniref:Glycosyltransferase n=1 Tax=Algoriphagus aquatilis TaxID=490186 RepID=A0ABW0BTG3_9BACT